MKKYESNFDITLTNRLPVIIRLDGKGFSKFTKKIDAEKPFDNRLSDWMANAMKNVASKIEGCVFGFTQSDEITLVLRNDQSLETVPWFGNRLQKICSITSSMITANFNAEIFNSHQQETDLPLAYFDARAFVVPNIDEMINCLIWRQQDCTKNSISCACYYEVAKLRGKKTTRKTMEGLNKKQQQELLFSETGINWNDYATRFKRGIGCRKVEKNYCNDEVVYTRSVWGFDYELPIFSTNRDYLKNIYLGTF